MGRCSVRTGQKLEKAVADKIGLAVSQTRFTINGRLRRPDFLDEGLEVIAEAKNVKYQSYTQQLADYAAYVRQEGYTFTLFINESTILSRTLDPQYVCTGINIVRVTMN